MLLYNPVILKSLRILNKKTEMCNHVPTSITLGEMMSSGCRYASEDSGRGGGSGRRPSMLLGDEVFWGRFLCISISGLKNPDDSHSINTFKLLQNLSVSATCYIESQTFSFYNLLIVSVPPLILQIYLCFDLLPVQKNKSDSVKER